MNFPRARTSAASRATEPSLDKRERGITGRVVILCLGLAVFFGYFSPIIDHKLANTFMGATHLPPGAIAAIFLLLVVVNLLLRLFSNRFAFYPRLA